MTVTQTFALIRGIPYNVTANRQSGEWRIRVQSNPDTDYFTDDNHDAAYTAIDMALRAQRFANLAAGSSSAAGHYVTCTGFGPVDVMRAQPGDILPALVMVGPFDSSAEAKRYAEKRTVLIGPSRYAGEYDADELGKIAADPEGWHYSSVWIKAPLADDVRHPLAQRISAVFGGSL